MQKGFVLFFIIVFTLNFAFTWKKRMSTQMDSLLSRLELVTSRLESVASGVTEESHGITSEETSMLYMPILIL